MKIGLALSGGGVRAAIFHLGVLKRLGDGGLLESVSHLSTVSGGSLITAAIMSNSGMKWPTSAEYNSRTYPELRKLLTSTDLFGFARSLWPAYLRYPHRLIADRAGLLAHLLESRWGITGRVQDLPEAPLWWINTTCLETGKNWRFSRREMGDWQFGKHYEPPFKLAQAAAASAAVPYAIGALSLKLPQDGWFKTNPATNKALERKSALLRKVRLWDGGAYENLGLEPIYKPEKGLTGCDFLICSDASGPLAVPPKSKFGILKGDLASPRLFDVASDQIRSLRSRMLMGSIQRGDIQGVLLRMGNSVRELDIKGKRERSTEEYDRFLTDREAALALNHPTNLVRVTEECFDRVARHGYEVADATLTAYCPTDFCESLHWKPAA